MHKPMHIPQLSSLIPHLSSHIPHSSFHIHFTRNLISLSCIPIHIPQLSSLIPHLSSHIPHLSSHIPHLSSHIPYPSTVIPCIPHLSSHIPQPSSHIPELSSHIPQSSSQIPQPPSHVSLNHHPMYPSTIIPCIPYTFLTLLIPILSLLLQLSHILFKVCNLQDVKPTLVLIKALIPQVLSVLFCCRNSNLF